MGVNAFAPPQITAHSTDRQKKPPPTIHLGKSSLSDNVICRTVSVRRLKSLKQSNSYFDGLFFQRRLAYYPHV